MNTFVLRHRLLMQGYRRGVTPLVARLRDLAGFGLLWAAVVSGIGILKSPESGLILIWVVGGIAAGLLISLDPARWWTALIPIGVASMVIYGQLGYNLTTLVVRSIMDIAVVVVYALVIRRRPDDSLGLGSNLGLVLVALMSATTLRMAVVTYYSVTGGDATSELLARYWGALVMATVAGLLAGTSLVLGIAHWREWATNTADRRACGLLGAGNIAVLLIVLASPIDASGFGGEFIVVPLLLWAALRCSPAFNATLSGVAVIVMAAGVAQRWGVNSGLSFVDVEDVIRVQVFWALLVLARGILTSVIAARRKAEARARASLANLQRLFVETPVPAALVEVDESGTMVIVDVNAEMTRTFGFERAPIGTPLAEAIGSTGELDPSVRQGPTLECRTAAGERLWVRTSVSVLASAAADRASGRRAVVVFDDVTTARALDELQRRQSGFDALTGLPNRESLLDDLDAEIKEGESLTVVLVNLYGTADINEAIGMEAGDRVLVAVRDRLLEVIDSRDLLARYGGDVFAVVRRNAVSEREGRDVAEAMLAAAGTPIHLGGHSLFLAATVGSTYCDVAGRTGRDVVTAADAALKEARRAGRNALRHRRLAAGEEPSAPRLRTELAVRAALDQDGLYCLYQPVVVAATGELVGAEALARVRLADGSMLPPAQFVPLVTELGLMPRLTEQVLEIACRQMAEWAAAGAPLPVAVNILPTWVTPENELLLLDHLARHGVPARDLTLEFTEDEAANLTEQALAVLARLGQAGVRVAIDDFGTGYASMASFRDVPSSVLKIDRTFVTGMLRTQQNRDLVASMIDLGHRFGKEIIAEGVETEEQLAALVRMDCDYIQGYLTGRPMSADEISGMTRV